jgi:transposase
MDLLPDRDAGSFAAWLHDHSGVEVVALDRADVYAEGTRRGAPRAIHVADRWHLLRNLDDAVRTAVARVTRLIQADPAELPSPDRVFLDRLLAEAPTLAEVRGQCT